MTLEQATKHLKDKIDPKDGGLYSLGWYLSWSPTDVDACLDGQFTPDDLEAIAAYMRENAK